MDNRSNNQVNTPKISIPKGGGTIRGADENFHADAFTGSLSFSIPVPLPAARGMAPRLSADYSSGSGNGLFGMGFHLPEDAVSIKTSRALPRYDGSDIYTLNSAELVPQNGEQDKKRTVFLERHQSAFVLIEKLEENENTYWRVVHNDNSVSVYGNTASARVFDPENNNRIFKWLISEHTDPEGNRVIYNYSRFGKGINPLLVAVEYGNYRGADQEETFAFKVWIDYGQFRFSETENTFTLQGTDVIPAQERPDCLLNYRAGFPVETRYLVRNIFVVHHFKDDPATGPDCIVRRLKFEYTDPDPLNPVSMLRKATEWGFIKTGPGVYRTKNLPVLDLGFTRFSDAGKTISGFRPLVGDDGKCINQPLQLVDYRREGAPGILYRNAETLYYYEALGNGMYRKSGDALAAPNPFSNPAQPLSLVSLEGNGELQLAWSDAQNSGYYPNDNDQWQDFVPFLHESLNDIPYRTEYADLSGGNRNDELIITPSTLYYRASLGLGGMERVRNEVPNDAQVEAENRNALNPFVFYGFADVYGDGLEHRIKIEDEKMTVWPNLGYGKFGKAMVIPVAGFSILKSQVDLRTRLVLADINGSGATDLVLVHPEKIQVFFNRSGSSFSAPVDFMFGDGLRWSEPDTIRFADVAGNGNTCLLFSKNSPHTFGGNYYDTAHYYYEFNSVAGEDGKPFLLKNMNNNMGLETGFFYKSSLKDYREAQKEKNPWTTKLSFPVMVLDKSVVTDGISNTAYSSRYKYRNGFYDPVEHSFLGFGCVSHTDLSESCDEVPAFPPTCTLTRQWFHTGAGTDETKIKKEFFQGNRPALSVPFQFVPAEYAGDPGALLALAGSELHSEVYDAGDLNCPYAAVSSSFEVVQVQSPTQKNRGVYRLFQRENISFNYEKRAEDAQVSHSFVLETDPYNQSLKSCTVAYPRNKPVIEEQDIMYCTAAEIILKNQDAPDLPRWIGIGLESKSYQVHGLQKPAGAYFTFDEIKKALVQYHAFVNPVAYSGELKPGVICTRLLSWQKQFYWNNEGQESAWDPRAAVPPVLLPRHAQHIVFDEANVKEILGEKKNEVSFPDAGYVFEDGYWWARSPVTRYGGAARFFQPQQDRFDWVEKSSYLYTESNTGYDDYALFPVRSAIRLNDETYLTTSAEMDYTTLSPWRVTDANGNRAEVLTDELGIVIASAVYEKDGTKNGDAPLREYQRPETVDLKEALLDDPLKYIQKAGSFFHYEFARFEQHAWFPACTLSLGRTVYKSASNETVQRSITYNDGFGRVIESRQWAGKVDGKDNQWLVSGRVTYNAKGLPAESYPGSFSDTYRHETEAEWKTRIAAQMLPPPATFVYDALDRQVQVNTPKGFFSRAIVLNAWETQHFDESDTVLESPYYKSGKWKTIPEEKDAIEKAVLFYNTPSTVVSDALGRQIIAVSSNRSGITAAIDWGKTMLAPGDIDPSDEHLLVSWQQFDIRGRVLLQADARFHEANQKLPAPGKKYNFRYQYPIETGLYSVTSTDAGTYCSVSDVPGNPLTGWDALGVKQEITYDNLQRPVSQSIKTPQGPEQVISKTLYGETVPGAAEKNMLGRACAHFDSAGRVTVPAFTFEGLAETQVVSFRTDYKTEARWDHDEPLEAETFITQTRFDAAQRPVSQTFPDGTVLTWQYGAMGNCVRSAITVAGQAEQILVNDSVLNEFGQLAGVTLGNNIHSRFDYDPLTQQIRQVKLQKAGAADPLQQLSYWHDPAGLVTTMQNDAGGKQFFNNQQVSPACSYTYDALYRLVHAGGRMLAAKNNATRNGRTNSGSTPGKVYANGDLQAVENYTEQYSYDKSNNLLKLAQISSNRFTRTFTIDAGSNRVSSYTQGDDTLQLNYNAAGYLLHVNGEGSYPLQWNSQGNIAKTTIVKRDGANDDAEYYVYSSGIRVRKVTERLENGKITVEDKRYIGDYKRTAKSSGKQLHSITAGGVQKHDCVVQYSSDAPGDVIFRFQHGNHLDSAGMETNRRGEIISYEEYSPFGETVYSYDPVNLDSMKEYRYSAQEKDANTGLYYYGYRYYAPSLCRWTRPDPAGTVDGFNLYAFVGNEPVGRVDVMGLKKRDDIKANIETAKDLIQNNVTEEKKQKQLLELATAIAKKSDKAQFKARFNQEHINYYLGVSDKMHEEFNKNNSNSNYYDIKSSEKSIRLVKKKNNSGSTYEIRTVNTEMSGSLRSVNYPNHIITPSPIGTSWTNNGNGFVEINKSMTTNQFKNMSIKKRSEDPVNLNAIVSNGINNNVLLNARNNKRAAESHPEVLHVIAYSAGGKNVFDNLYDGSHALNTLMIPFEAKAKKLMNEGVNITYSVTAQINSANRWMTGARITFARNDKNSTHSVYLSEYSANTLQMLGQPYLSKKDFDAAQNSANDIYDNIKA